MYNNIIVRLSLRKVVEDITDIAEFVKLYFTDGDGNIDPELSVYSVENTGRRVLQIKAEHTAFGGADPSVKAAIDITGLFTVPITPDHDGGCFNYRNTRHCILQLGSNPQDANVIAQKYIYSPLGRFWIADKSQVTQYGRKMYKLNDQEWMSAASSSGKIMRWVSKSYDSGVSMDAIRK